MSDKATEVSAHNAVPRRAFSLVELKGVSLCRSQRKDVRSYSSFDVVRNLLGTPVSRQSRTRVEWVRTFSIVNLSIASCAVCTLARIQESQWRLTRSRRTNFDCFLLHIVALFNTVSA